ncbi:MAG: hypothetical protein ABW321_28760 [Polyangiales bacterium]
MKAQPWLSWTYVWLSGVLAACAGTETGNPSFDGTIGYDAYSSTTSVALADSALTNAAVTVDTTWLVLGPLGFLPSQSCANPDKVQTPVPGLGAGDHVGGQAPPTPYALESGLYCGARLPLIHSSDAPSDAPALVNHSLLVRGRLADGRTFELRSALREALSLDATEAFTLDAEQAGVLVGFDVGVWLDGLPWDQATAGSDGKIVADETQNTALLERFEARLPAGVALFRDRDRDGLIDDQPIELARGSE